MDLPQTEFQLLYSHGIDIYNRRIYLVGEITEESSSHVIRAISMFARIPDPIDLVIQSTGGDLTAAFAIYDTIQETSNSSTPIHSVGTGEVCSSALLLLSCGITRSATQNVYAMVHSPSSIIPEGETHTVLSGATAIDEMGKRMWKLLERHTKWSAKEWSDEAKSTGEVWMTARDLQQRGVIDDIISVPYRRVKRVTKQQEKQRKKATTARKR